MTEQTPENPNQVAPGGVEVTPDEPETDQSEDSSDDE